MFAGTLTGALMREKTAELPGDSFRRLGILVRCVPHSDRSQLRLGLILRCDAWRLGLDALKKDIGWMILEDTRG